MLRDANASPVATVSHSSSDAGNLIDSRTITGKTEADTSVGHPSGSDGMANSVKYDLLRLANDSPDSKSLSTSRESEIRPEAPHDKSTPHMPASSLKSSSHQQLEQHRPARKRCSVHFSGAEFQSQQDQKPVQQAVDDPQVLPEHPPALPPQPVSNHGSATGEPIPGQSGSELVTQQHLEPTEQLASEQQTSGQAADGEGLCQDPASHHDGMEVDSEADMRSSGPQTRGDDEMQDLKAKIDGDGGDDGDDDMSGSGARSILTTTANTQASAPFAQQHVANQAPPPTTDLMTSLRNAGLGNSFPAPQYDAKLDRAATA